jgi:hypothetical protein
LRLAKDLVSKLELVYMVCRLIEHAVAQVKEELSQTC